MDARPLNLVRPEVPVELAALVAKMMAKEPGRRFQTPGEVAQALVPFFKPARTSASRTARRDLPRRAGRSRLPSLPAVGPRRRNQRPLGTATARGGGRRRPKPEGVEWESLIEFKETEALVVPAVPKPAPKPKHVPAPQPPSSGASPSLGLGVDRGRGVALRCSRRLGGYLQDQERDDRLREPPRTVRCHRRR